jgi:hypothetical protein
VSETVPPKRPKHAAPGQYLGFALQPVRLCYHLLTCPPKAKASLEYLDDVAVHYANGATLLEQAKSALKQNPVSDWANDFWKCLANWLSSIRSGTIPAESTQFTLYVTPVKTGKRAAELSEATTSEQLEKLVNKIRVSLSKTVPAPTCLPYLESFLNATPAERFAVIERFSLISKDADPVDPIRVLIAPVVAANLIDPLCQFAIGRAKESADRLIRAGEPSIVDGDEFKREFRNFVQKNNLPGLLVPFTVDPPQGAVSSLLATHPIFVKQLDLVQVDEDERVRAVSDFLRAAADKSTWAEAGLVFEKGLEEWDAELIRRHGLIRGEVSDVHAEKDSAVRGRIVYRRSAQMQPALDGQSVPGHFIHGCLNKLADSKTIGWHPDFIELLKEEGE